MQYAEMANDVACLIEQRGFSGTTILGHSMGGKTAMALVQTGMTELHKLIVADIAPVPYQHSHSEFVKAMTAVNFTEVRARKDVEKQLEVEISDPMIRQFLMQNLMRQQNRFQWRINLDAIAENMEFLLGYDHKQSSDTDTLFIAGGNSGYIVPDVYPEISRLFPLSKIVTIDNAGHWLHAEQPEKFIKLVWEFINK